MVETWVAIIPPCPGIDNPDREADELLGGAFDYTAMRRELERARRASRLLQRTAAAGAVAPAAVAGAEAVAALHARGVTPLSGGVGRVRSAAGPSASAAQVAHKPRGDFRGVLPPIHSVWDLDEAWLDMDEFTKVRLALRRRSDTPGHSGPGTAYVCSLQQCGPSRISYNGER